MQWKIRQFVFCEDKQHLLGENEPIQLEPRQAEVLAYFCRNPEKLISRDELVENVWQGQAVTDNAVNRIIAKLRKSLGDTAKQSDFIVTLPRKGYRFVVPVSTIESPLIETNTEQEDGSEAIINYKLMLIVFAVLLAITAISTLYSLQPNKVDSYQFQSVKALTRDKGEEFLPSVSPDGNYLIYSDYKHQRLDLYLKDIHSGESRLISDQLGNAGNGDWSRAGDQFVYLYNTEESCELRVITFDLTNSMQIKDKQTVHQCPQGSFGNFAFTHDGRSIIYSETDKPSGSYQIYVKNLDSGKTRRLNQPPIFLAGHYAFDLHPTENKLLLATPDKTQQLAFYILDMDTDSLDYRFNLEGYTCCPLWNHDGSKIIMTGALPSFSIIEMDLDGENLETIYSSSHRVYKLKRIPNSQSFVYSGGINNSDIQFTDFGDQSVKNIISSTVADYKPTVSNNELFLAYISQKSGSGQIWVHDIESGTDRKLTQFEDNHQYFDLKWSPNDQKILALTINSLKLIDFISGQETRLNLDLQQIRGISWVDDNRVAFSLKQNEQWQVFHYDLVNKRLIKTENSKNYAYYSSTPNEAGSNIPLELENEQFYFNDVKLNLRLDSTIDHNRRFYFQFKGVHLYYIQEFLPEIAKASDQNPTYRLVDFNVRTQKSAVLTPLNRGAQFSLAENGVYFVKTVGRNADIFKVDFVSR
ncbi:MAG: winged helix-turn-helix domain-containing protein [Kangiellaceae bacterium]|nr:winged helix-turn-helix domain-containing protein [Kangiellaceae bacterium]